MNSYLVDIPVRLNVFVRPDNLKQVFDIIREARPSILFLVSDGPRDGVPTDKKMIEASRKVVEEIDWDCKVHRLYAEKNQGMYTTAINAWNYIFSIVDRCIMLEDDVVPSVTFFQFCADLLEKYKDDRRIHMICGMNQLGVYEETNTDYFFSKGGSIWGFAIWRRTFEYYDYDFNFGNDPYILNKLKENIDRNFYKKMTRYAKGELVEGHIAGSEFFLGAALYLQNSLNLVSTKNMICNIGVGDGSVHSADSIREMPKGIRRVFFMKTYEYDFPLKHPQFVIEDKYYEKKVNRIMGKGHPFVSFYRRIESLIRRAIFGDRKKLLKRILSKLLMEKQIER